MKRLDINAVSGMSGYSLSQMVAEIRFFTGIDKAVLRALCDHYPNVWPDVDPTIADQSGWSATSVREAMRRLELQNWINGIKPLKKRLGGQGNSEQYVINDRKISDAHALQELEDDIQAGRIPLQNPVPPTENPPPAIGLVTENPSPAVGLVKNTQRHTSRNPTRGERTQRVAVSNPSPAVGEPTIEPTNEPTTNLPSLKEAAGRLAEIFGQEVVKSLPGGTGKRNQTLVAEAMKIAPNQVVNLWKHWLKTREREVLKA